MPIFTPATSANYIVFAIFCIIDIPGYIISMKLFFVIASVAMLTLCTKAPKGVTSMQDDICYIEPNEALREQLGEEAYRVLVEAATEPPFRNAYWNNHEEGIYVDKIDGTPLFASTTKFDSGTGWPSFFAPIDEKNLILVEDNSFGMRRIEVRSKSSGGHLGHVFDDGPAPTGKRYCINSASIKFIPKEALADAGYINLLSLFDN